MCILSFWGQRENNENFIPFDFNITGHEQTLTTTLLSARSMDFFLCLVFLCVMLLTRRWILVAPDLTSVFGEGFPPLYKRGFKVDESKHSAICIHCLIEPMENYSRFLFSHCQIWHH